MLTLALTVVFISVAIGAGTTTHMVLADRTTTRRRLRALVDGDSLTPRAVTAATAVGLTATPHPLAVRLAKMLPRSAGRVAEIRQRLALAGYRASSAPVAFTAAQVGCALAVAFALFAVGGIEHIAWPALGAIGGALLPEAWLMHRRNAREHAIRNAMPDGMDLLVICLEAGCSLDQAILKSAEELRLARPELADELALVINETRAGRSRADAFRQFGVRSRVEEVHSLVSILVQTDRYGTSVTNALRMHGEVCRTRRRQRAEERAGKASVKMVFPLVFCLFPAFFLISLGPTMIQFFRTLNQVTFGG
jgi:tight adherence protein C